MEPLISVVIPNYNNGQYITRCLSSLINQSYQNIEIIVVDDGSTDNSVEVITQMQSSNQRIILIRQENAGVSSARNKGIERVTGDFLYFLDADDWVSNDFFEKVIACGLQDKDGVVFQSVLVDEATHGEYQKLAIYQSGIKNQKQMLSEVISLYGIQGYGFNKVFRTEIVRREKIRFSEEVHFAEDLLFCVEYFCKVERSVIAIPDTLHYYYQHSDSALANYKKKVFSKKILTDLDAKTAIVAKVSLMDRKIMRLANISYTYSWINITSLASKDDKDIFSDYSRPRLLSFFLAREIRLRTKAKSLIKVLRVGSVL